MLKLRVWTSPSAKLRLTMLLTVFVLVLLAGIVVLACSS